MEGKVDEVSDRELPSSIAMMDNNTNKENLKYGEKRSLVDAVSSKVEQQESETGNMTANDFAETENTNTKKPKLAKDSGSLPDPAPETFTKTKSDQDLSTTSPATENNSGMAAVTPPQSSLPPPPPQSSLPPPPPPPAPAATSGVSTTTTVPQTSEVTSQAKASTLHDMCETLELKAGDRIEVLWDITQEEEDSNEEGRGAQEKETVNSSSDQKKSESESKEVETRWWGATLLPLDDPLRYYVFDEVADGEAGDRERVPIRILDYDPYPEGGFPEKSLNEVAFLSDKLIYDMGIKGSLMFRKAGSSWTPSREELDELHSETNAVDNDESGVPCPTPSPTASAAASSAFEQSREEDGGAGNNEGYGSVSLDGTKASVLPILDAVLAKALANVQPRLASLSADRQLYVAEQIAKAKEKLADKLVEEFQIKGTRQITPSVIKICMEEVGKELAALKDA